VKHDLGTSLLAVIRIISVLGMALAIAGGIFLMLWGKLLLGVLACVAFLPFFYVMRFMERYGAAHEWGIGDELSAGEE
jgi:hypothetical protein